MEEKRIMLEGAEFTKVDDNWFYQNKKIEDVRVIDILNIEEVYQEHCSENATMFRFMADEPVENENGILLLISDDDSLFPFSFPVNNKEEMRKAKELESEEDYIKFLVQDEVILDLILKCIREDGFMDQFCDLQDITDPTRALVYMISIYIEEHIHKHITLDSLFEETDFQGFGSISDLNKTLIDPIKVISRDDFVKKHKDDPSYTLDGLVARISVVYALSEAYIISFKNGTFIEVYYDGRISKNGAVPAFKMTTTDSHSRIVNLLGYNSSIFAEKLIGIAISWLTNQLPETFTGLVVNVKDGSGTLDTARKLGIPVNLSPYNLEWTLPEDNIAHGRRLMSLAKRTGKVYRFSANDRKLKEVYQLKDDAALRDYMDAHYPVVRDYKGEV